MRSKLAAIAVAVLLAAGAALSISKINAPRQENAHASARGAALDPAQVAIPALTLTERRGEAAFNTNCAKCHGKNATGTDQGPPFLHPVYRPGHHADGAFALAVKNGVRPHHWPFGPMPPQPQVGPGELKAIVAYVRALQRANGIAE